MICTTIGCGCAIQSSSLEITGTGGEGTPYVIETNAFAIVTSVTRPSTPFTNQFIFETDTELSWRWDGSEWKLFAWTKTPRFQGQTVNTTVTYNVEQTRPIDTETYDPFDWHSVGQPTRVTPDIPGYYRVYVAGSWQSALDYQRTIVGCRVNGTVINTGRHDTYVDATGHRPFMSHAVYDAIEIDGVDDYIEPDFYQSNVAEGSRTLTFRISVEWIGNLL